MKKGDFIWGLMLAAFVAFIALPKTHAIFVGLNAVHPYLIGFIKFGILATMGEVLAIRISTKEWNIPYGITARAIIWGLIGMLITLIFQIFSGGVTASMAKGYLPGGESKILFAFYVGSIMNLTFAPTFMAAHRFSDTYIDMKGEGIQNITVTQIVNRIDWNTFVSFVVMKTIPFFWIPAHTLTFLLPGEYRVLVAAFLSIALGILLALGKRK